MHAIREALERIWILPRRLMLDTRGVAATVPMLRGVWGAALHDLDREAYEKVFRAGESERGAPPAYVLRPVVDGGTAVDWILIGSSAIQRDAKLLMAWGAAMERGLGESRVPFRVSDVRGLGPDGTDSGRPRPWRLSQAVWPLDGEPEGTPCRLTFCTPLALLRQGELIQRPTLKDLVVRAGWRIESFLPPSRREAWRAGRGAVIELAAGIEARPWQGQRLDLRRYSARQQKEFQVPGVCGWLDLPQGPGPLWPLLAALHWIHLGKSTIVGLGQVLIQA
ncbi:MAG TPA: CRISPR system precrRNA processing endoribonuclease RAMP protein Cas6 [Candidatus Anammoximicrobium sp.]|nr:CRISPR system precrRNA processing endoribonuclease RAMP protein Cas6 [Candidatus Anammoximicrobium sp.]